MMWSLVEDSTGAAIRRAKHVALFLRSSRNRNTGFLTLVSGRVVGQPQSAGINRHVVGDERALQERKAANPSWPRVLQAMSRGIA
jgi:hypothetical protein